MKKIFIVLMSVFFAGVLRAEAESKNFALRSRLQTSYNDNVTLAHQDEISDVVQTVLLGLDFKRITQRNNFLLQADVARNFYFEKSALYRSKRGAFSASCSKAVMAAGSFCREPNP